MMLGAGAPTRWAVLSGVPVLYSVSFAPKMTRALTPRLLIRVNWAALTPTMGYEAYARRAACAPATSKGCCTIARTAGVTAGQRGPHALRNIALTNASLRTA